MTEFIRAVNCPNCGELIMDDGVTADFTVEPCVVVLDNFACTSFHCKHCGTDVFTGDVDCMYDYEDSNDESDNEE